MASSGSFNTSDYQNRYLTFSWYIKSQSVTDNKTTIAWTLQGAGDATTSYYYTQNIKVIIDGETVYNKPKSEGQILLYNGTVVASGTYTFSHNAEGKRSFQAYAEAGIYVWAVNCTGSGTFDIDTIPRASDISSVSNTNLGSNCYVAWYPKATSFRYKLKFTLGNWSHTTDAIAPNTTSAYTYTGYTIPLDVAAQFPTRQSGAMTVTLYSYSDTGATNQIGTDSTTFIVTLPDNSTTQPAVTMVLSPVGTIPSKFSGLYIQGKSKVKAALTANGKYGATIQSDEMSVSGSNYGPGSEYTSEYLTQYGSTKVIGRALDSRGLTGIAEETIEVIPYVKPRLLDVECNRCDASGNLTDEGTYLKIKAVRSYSPVTVEDVQKNFCKIQYRYKAESAQAYSSWVTILASNSLGSDEVNTAALIGTLSATTTYNVQIQAIDDIGDYAETTITVSTSEIYTHEHGAIGSLGFGMYVSDPNMIDIAEKKTVRIRGKATIVKAPTADTDAVNLKYVRETFAPLGYGLGESVFIEWTAIDTAKAPGWYRTNVDYTSLGGIMWDAAAWLRVDGYDGNALCQTLYLASDAGLVLRRFCNGGVWQTWECVNPPMHTSVEYRTTERWRGKPVYRKLISYTFANGIEGTANYNIPHGITDTIEVIRISGFTGGYVLPYITGTEVTCITGVDSTNIILASAGTTWNNTRVWYFDMAYTKGG